MKLNLPKSFVEFLFHLILDINAILITLNKAWIYMTLQYALHNICSVQFYIMSTAENSTGMPAPETGLEVGGKNPRELKYDPNWHPCLRPRLLQKNIPNHLLISVLSKGLCISPNTLDPLFH